MSSLKLVIFDVDGTLVDSQSEIIASMHIAFDAVGLAHPTRDQILNVVGLSLPATFECLMPLASQDIRDRAVAAYKQAFHDNRIKGARPILYDGMVTLLDRLEQDQNMLLAIATGKSRRGLVALLEMYGWQKRFISTQVSDDHPSKPHPSMIQSALSETGVDASSAVMVGDTTYDMDMARAAGVAGIGVSWGYHPVSALVGAQAVVSDAQELYSAIKRQLG